MKNLNIFKNFRSRLTALLILAMLFVGVLNNLLIYKFALDSQLNSLRVELMTIAQASAMMIDADSILQVPLNRDGVHTPQFKVIADKLEKIKRINPSIKYIYTMTKTDQEGVWQFVVDPDYLGKEQKENNLTSYPGDKYNAERFPEMLKSFNIPSADKKLGRDEWGVFLSGYAPVLDANGKPIAILGVDVAAEDVFATQKAVHIRSILVLFLGISLSIILGIIISGGTTKPLKELVKEIRHMAAGNLNHKVKAEGADEISELAKSFNQMAVNLHDSKRKLLDYFYSVVQSLVRILEARDQYTKGHAERVAEYSEKIALRMGCPRNKIELVREIAVLHDIGKLGIQESILNKKEKLTEEEWEIIRKHPAIGEEILKPILLTDEMLAVVRGHHERYDGKGYPDKIGGEGVNIFAAIVSVADAYDAMTSPRAYRPAMTKEEAIRELEKNKGTQFNPKVVDVLLQILKEEEGSEA